MQRDNPGWCSAAFGVAVLAGVMVVAAGLLSGGVAKVFLGVGLAMFLGASIAGIVLLINARSDRPAPSVDVKLESTVALAVAGTVKVEEMTSHDTLTVRVVAGPTPNSPRYDQLYYASLGPDASGTAQIGLDVPLPATGYAYAEVQAWVNTHPGNCFATARNSKQTPGCVYMRLPVNQT
jgi:hypothetical protein